MMEFNQAVFRFIKRYNSTIIKKKSHLTPDQINRRIVLSFRNTDELEAAGKAFPETYRGYKVIREVTYDYSKLITIVRDQFRIEFAKTLDEYGCFANLNSFSFKVRIDSSDAAKLEAIAKVLPTEYMGFPVEYQQTDFRAL